MTARARLLCAALAALAAWLVAPRDALAQVTDHWGCDSFMGVLTGGGDGACCDVHDACYATYGCHATPERWAAVSSCTTADIVPNIGTCTACVAAAAFYAGDPCFYCDLEAEHCIVGPAAPGPSICTNLNGQDVCETLRNNNNPFGCVDDRFCAGQSCEPSTGQCGGGVAMPPPAPSYVGWPWPFNGCLNLCASMGQCGFGLTPCGLTYFGSCASNQECQNNQCVACSWVDCAGTCNGSAQTDQCGVCNGDGSSCCQWYDCAGTCNGSAHVDCDGVCGGSATYDSCGVCGGDGSSCACQWYDCFGVCNGGATYDSCGVCGGDGSECACQWYDCNGVCNGGASYDACGVCGGDGSECGGGGGCGGGCGGCGWGCGWGCGGGCGCGSGCYE
jgi:hypothetical protein